MNLTITARGYKAHERLKKYISDKLNRKSKLFEEVIDFEVVLSYEKLVQVAEFKLQVNNRMIVAREKSEDIFKSIDMALDNSERQIKRFKDKQRDHDNRKIIDNLVA
jgi:putative sigma-54 modulation protein